LILYFSSLGSKRQTESRRRSGLPAHLQTRVSLPSIGRIAAAQSVSLRPRSSLAILPSVVSAGGDAVRRALISPIDAICSTSGCAVKQLAGLDVFALVFARRKLQVRPMLLRPSVWDNCCHGPVLRMPARAVRLQPKKSPRHDKRCSTARPDSGSAISPSLRRV